MELLLVPDRYGQRTLVRHVGLWASLVKAVVVFENCRSDQVLESCEIEFPHGEE